MTPSPNASKALTNRRVSAPAIAGKLLGAALLAAVAGHSGAALAGPVEDVFNEPQDSAASAERQSLMVMIDHLRRVSFDEPVHTVLVGNPAIADVTMISTYEAVVTAKTVGSTNLFFLDPDGRALGDYDVVVREGEERRVVLRRGPSNTELFQCAPRCERTLSQIDTAENYTKLNEVVVRENQLVTGATAGNQQGQAPTAPAN